MSSPDKAQNKLASNAALASLLNLTFLPGFAFIWLLLVKKQSVSSSLAHYHIMLGIKLNLIAFVVLGIVSIAMVIMGGFHSAWTWVYVITYFTFVHTTFIIIAIWALTRAWAGLKLN